LLRLGEIGKEGPCESVFAAPKHEYTRVLIDAIPLPTANPEWLRRTTAAEVAG
jgi:ABC-type oligopeptide transport system ATPase subunit